MNEESILENAKKIENEDVRLKFLRLACGADSDAIQRLMSQVQLGQEFTAELEPPSEAMSMTLDSASEENLVGGMIGPYKLLQQVGEGGMGTVYMAEQQQPVKRRVAVKVVKPGMDSKQVLARFEAERQALALMDHPNVARVLDVGATESGRPYFVMELVKGIPITEFCDENCLSVRERLELFSSVCRAIQHAHQKGIIHRDIKPSNILVAEYDDQAVPKVIDFGLAKALNQTLTEKTMFTHLGQVVGTLEYMSPEQSKMNQLDVDTRSDIYSLGVLLYELLTGAPPFDRSRLRTAAFEEVLRIIREEEPMRPSTRVSSVETASRVASNRAVEQKKLSFLLKGDLDWIVMKALDKERSRRYESASSLAEDVRHYLDDEPVDAGPPSVRYRIRKFARKHRALVLTIGTVFFLLLAGIGGTSWGMILALKAEARAEAKTESERKAKGEALAARESFLNEARTSANLLSQIQKATSDSVAAQYYFQRTGIDGPLSADIIIPGIKEFGHRIPHRASNTFLSSVLAFDVHPYRESGFDQLVFLRGQTIGSRLLPTFYSESPSHTNFGQSGYRDDRVLERKAFSIGYSNSFAQVVVFADGLVEKYNLSDNEIDIERVYSSDANASNDCNLGTVSCAQFSGNRERLVVGSKGGQIVVLETESLTTIARFSTGDELVAVSIEGDTVVSSNGLTSKESRLLIHDVKDKSSEPLDMEHTGPITCLAINSELQLAAAGYDHVARIIDLRTEGEETIKLEGHQSWITALAWNESGNILATGSQDGQVIAWSRPNGSLEAEVLVGHPSLITHLKFFENVPRNLGDEGSARAWLFSSSLDNTMKVWPVWPAKRESLYGTWGIL